MTEYPKDIRFKYSWRKYQQRMLDELQDHITDGHLHVIAPPGSGKTVLGLEVAIRLNKPTLILAPTIAIRNQWVQRFCALFLQTHQVPEWISRDIRNPKFMTVVTYQGLHAACNDLREEEKDSDDADEESEAENNSAKSGNKHLGEIVRGLRSQKVKTIVVDEAHHLKNEWWHTLSKVKDSLDPAIVGLTATPPYDVSAAEWQRYITLNGPVDTEISVPELVMEGDLCPHQDYVHFTLPTEKEYLRIVDFRRNVEKLFNEIKQDKVLVEAVENHPIWLEPTGNLEWIYTNLSCYSACLIFLHAYGREIPPSHLEVIDDKEVKIPKLDFNWMETLLDFYLYKEKDHFDGYEEHRKLLVNKLRRYGVLERRQIQLSHNKRITGLLTSSISKLNSIKEIVDFEYRQLGVNLRLVILTDYIRKEFFVNDRENRLDLNKIGVVPIFERLRRDNPEGKKIGVMTGSMIIIPVSAYPSFEAKARKYGIDKISSSPVPFDDDYLLVYQTIQLKHDIVHIITQIFQDGEIEVLIGTKSLLGEGWDAPAINALILASFVGSFVSSNQMRGRAIRTQNGNDIKTGNIWHLVCVDPTLPTGGDDLELLERRFRSFVGVSFKDGGGIENGTGRLDLPDDIHQKAELERKNMETFSAAGDRKSLKQRWKTALETGINLVEEIKIPFAEERPYQQVKAMYLNKTIASLMTTLGFGVMGYLQGILEGIGRSARYIESWQDFYMFLTAIGIGGVVFFGRQTYKTLMLYLKYRDISKDIQHIGEALLNALIKAEIIHTDPSALRVEASMDSFGAVYCHLEGGTTFEKSTFINALQEIIGPIDNPRYVIIRKSLFLKLLKQKDYHAVPDLLGRNKNLAAYLAGQWKKYVGNCDLIYTRTIEGRRILLASRMNSLASQFEKEIEHINKWR